MDEQKIFEPAADPVPEAPVAPEAQVIPEAPAAPEAPAFEAPAEWSAPAPQEPEDAPAEPQYQAPAEPQYQAPAEPQYQPPQQPQYQQPQYQQPQYQAPQQPQYQPPQQPQYQPPQQPQFQQPQSPYQQQFQQYQRQQPGQAGQYQQQFQQYQNRYQPQQPAQPQYQPPYGQPAYQPAQPYGRQSAPRSFPIVQLILAILGFAAFFTVRMFHAKDTFRALEYYFKFNNVEMSIYTIFSFITSWLLYVVALMLVLHLAVQYQKGRSYSLAGVSFIALGISMLIPCLVSYLTYSVILPLVHGYSADTSVRSIIIAAVYLLVGVISFAAASGLFKGRGKAAAIIASLGMIGVNVYSFVTILANGYAGSLSALEIFGFISEVLIGVALLVYAIMLKPANLQQNGYQQNYPPVYFR